MFPEIRPHQPDENRRTYAESIIGLIGHLLGTGVIFVSLFLVAWAASLLLHFLHEIYPFPDQILVFITKFELYLIYGDSVFCVLVLLGGAYRFITDGWRK